MPHTLSDVTGPTVHAITDLVEEARDRLEALSLPGRRHQRRPLWWIAAAVLAVAVLLGGRSLWRRRSARRAADRRAEVTHAAGIPFDAPAVHVDVA